MDLKLYISIGLLFCCTLLAQRHREHPEPEEARNKGKAILAHLSVGTHLLGGDLADRFGRDGAAGLGAEWITASNFIISNT